LKQVSKSMVPNCNFHKFWASTEIHSERKYMNNIFIKMVFKQEEEL